MLEHSLQALLTKLMTRSSRLSGMSIHCNAPSWWRRWWTKCKSVTSDAAFFSPAVSPQILLCHAMHHTQLRRRAYPTGVGHSPLNLSKTLTLLFGSPDLSSRISISEIHQRAWQLKPLKLSETSLKDWEKKRRLGAHCSSCVTLWSCSQKAPAEISWTRK